MKKMRNNNNNNELEIMLLQDLTYYSNFKFLINNNLKIHLSKYYNYIP